MTIELPEALKGLDENQTKALTELIDQAKAPLVNNHNNLLSEKKALEEQIKQFGGLDTLKRLKDEAEENRLKLQKAALEGNDVEKIKKTLQDRLDEKEKELNLFKQSTLEEKVSNLIDRAVRDAKGIPELLSHVVRSRIRAELDGGKLITIVLDEYGSPMFNGNNKEATVGDLIESLKLKDAYKVAFRTDASGSGSTPSNGVPIQSDNPWSKGGWNFTRQNQIAKQDPVKAKLLKQQAGINT